MPSTTGLEVPRDTDHTVSSASTLAGDHLSSDEKVIEPRASGDEKHEDSVKEQVQSDELSEDEYPSGIKMVFIVVALVLSIFLLSLDMVRFKHPASESEHGLTLTRPLSQLPFPKSRMSSRASTRSDGTAPPFS